MSLIPFGTIQMPNADIDFVYRGFIWKHQITGIKSPFYGINYEFILLVKIIDLQKRIAVLSEIELIRQANLRFM